MCYLFRGKVTINSFIVYETMGLKVNSFIHGPQAHVEGQTVLTSRFCQILLYQQRKSKEQRLPPV